MAVNLVGYDNDRIKQLTTDNTANLAIRVLEYMATSNAFTGSITIGNSNPIGVFTDTVRSGGVGSADIIILSNTYTLSQVNTATLTSTQNSPQYLGLDYSNPNITKLKENLTSLNDLADYILSVATTSGPFSYYLGTSAPLDGGVWISLGSLLDTLQGFTVLNTEYRLWKKISSGSVVNVIKPLRIKNSRIASFTDNEIDSLVKTVEERIVSTGVGTYALQATVPSIGTWVSAGSITDIRRSTSVGSFAVDYFGEANFIASFTGSYIGAVNFLGTTPATFFGTTPATFFGTTPATFFGTTPTTFFGTTPATFFGTTPTTFFGTTPVAYTGVTSATYTGVTSATYTGTTMVGYEGTAFGFQYLGFGMEPFTGFAPVTYFEPAPTNFFGTTPANFFGSTPTNFFGFTPTTSFGFTPTTSFGFTPTTSFGFTPTTSFGVTPTTSFGVTPTTSFGVTPANYGGESSFLGTASFLNYVGSVTYTGTVSEIVNGTTENVSIITLWKRIS